VSLTIIRGGKDNPGFVCPWCGFKAMDRPGLNEHWANDPRCRKNKEINNQTQSKLGQANQIITQPGEDTLRKVRARDCKHETMEDLVDAEGTVIGRQCMNCYSAFEPSDE
jgi:hypothetical protein